MARIGFLGDIHGNITALTDVLNAMDNEDIETYVCLGDFVAEYHDDECVQKVQPLVNEGRFLSVLGNHDEQAIEGLLKRSDLSMESLAYLKSLPFALDVHGIHITHGNPIEAANEGKGVWRNYGDYIHAHNVAELVFEACDHRIIVVGHTHIPIVYTEEEQIDPVSTDVCLREGRFILNPGAVGYSRVATNTANYGLLETDTMLFTVKCVKTQSLYTFSA